MSLFARERRTASLQTLTQVLEANGRPSRTSSTPPVTDDRALRVAAFWGCVQLLTRNVSTLPVDAYRRTPKARVAIDPQPPLVASPSAIVSRSTWVGQFMMSMLLRGNTFLLVTQTGKDGWPLKAEIVHPDDVRIFQDSPLTPPSYTYRGAPVPNGLMKHVSSGNGPGSVVGMSPVTYAAWTLGLAIGSIQYGSELMNGGGHPTAVLTTDQVIDKDQAERTKTRFKAATDGDHLAVLGGGWKYDTVQISPVEAQLLETRQFSAVEICQFMGVPPTKIGAAMSGTSVTYANREQNQQEYLSDALMWWITRIEEAWSSWLPRQQIVKFNVGALMRPDADTSSRIIDRKLRNGTLNADEARALDDRAPLPDRQGELFIWPPAAPAPTQGTPNA